MVFSGTVNKPRETLKDQLRIFCRITLRGISSFYFSPNSGLAYSTLL
jgi:hypothetical protein